MRFPHRAQRKKHLEGDLAGEGGPLYYQALLRTADRSLPDQPRSHGLSIERAAAPSGYDGRRRPATTRFALGDWVELSAVVTTPVPREQVALVLPLPAGLEAVDPLHASTARIALAPGLDERHPSHVERHDDRVELFFDRLPAGSSRVAELARATIAGEFVVPPATVKCLYAPGVRGSTAAMRVTVAGGDGRRGAGSSGRLRQARLTARQGRGRSAASSRPPVMAGARASGA